VREDPDREGLLYAGTEFGMFVSFDDGTHWQRLQLNLPATPITDIELVRGDLALSTMGRSFWILDNVTPLHALDAERGAELAQADAHLFEPRPSYRMRYRAPGGFGPVNPASPQYPPAGATIDYYLGAAPEGDVSLEILDATRQLVRRFEPGTTDEGDAGGGGGGGGGGRDDDDSSGIDTAPGMHRFNWDLRHQVPEGAGRGPIVLPGAYTARLTVADEVQERRLDVRIDRRVWAEGVTQEDLEAQFELNMQVTATLVEARRVADEVEALQRELEETVEGGEAAEGLSALRAELAELRATLVDDEGSYPQPMLISQLDYLSEMISDADQLPGRDAYERLEQLQSELAQAAAALAELQGRGQPEERP
jgi:hypothetical protein